MGKKKLGYESVTNLSYEQYRLSYELVDLYNSILF